MNNNNNNFLFFSNYCDHSKRLLEILEENNLTNNYELCCVDSSEIEIPEFITSVPTIYLSNQKRLLVDDALFHYINIEVNRNSQNTENSQQMPQQQMPQQQMPQQQMPQQQMPQQPSQPGQQPSPEKNDDISGFFNKEMGNSLSDSYSFINSDKSLEHSFAFIEQKNEDKLQQEDTGKNDFNKKSKGTMMNDAYEQLMAQRGSDLPQNVSQMRV
jgi:hypothetical protein